MKDCVIVSCGIGEHYRTGLMSTRQHCERYCPEADLLMFDDYPAGCPPHAEQMYAFKIFAMREAIERGWQYVLWMDAWFQPIASIVALWEHIRRTGWYIPAQGDSVLGNWCTDSALAKFEISRETARTIPLCYSGLVGLDMGNRLACGIWKHWEQLFTLGTFNGPHLNVPGEPMTQWGLKWQGHASDDTAVNGHRHDESALSFVLHSLSLKPPGDLGFLTIESPGGFIGHHVPAEALCPGA